MIDWLIQWMVKQFTRSLQFNWVVWVENRCLLKAMWTEPEFPVYIIKFISLVSWFSFQCNQSKRLFIFKMLFWGTVNNGRAFDVDEVPLTNVLISQSSFHNRFRHIFLKTRRNDVIAKIPVRWTSRFDNNQKFTLKKMHDIRSPCWHSG